MKFTHITIKPIFKNRKYSAEFNVEIGKTKVETTIAGNSPEECIEKVERFLEVKLTKDNYTIE